MQIVETMFEARAPGQVSVTRNVLEDLIRDTDTWVGREIFVVHRLKGLNKLTHTRCFGEDIFESPAAQPIDSASWTGRARDVPEKPIIDDHGLPEQFREDPVSSAKKPNPVPTPYDLRDDLIRRLTDCARDLDTLGFRGWAEDVRYVRNMVRKGVKDYGRDKLPLDRAWEHLRQADRDLVEAKQPVLAKLAVLLRDDVGELLSRKRAPASCADLDQADKMGKPIGTVTKAEPAGEGYPKGYTRCTVEFGSATKEIERERLDDDVRKAERETGRQEGLRQALRDIENYPTAFAAGMKRNLVNLIQARIRGEW